MMSTTTRVNASKEDLAFVKRILPENYLIRIPAYDLASINCVSNTGICLANGNEDEEHWFYIFQAIKQYFGSRFMEVYHHTCTNHVNFTIYLK